MNDVKRKKLINAIKVLLLMCNIVVFSLIITYIVNSDSDEKANQLNEVWIQSEQRLDLIIKFKMKDGIYYKVNHEDIYMEITRHCENKESTMEIRGILREVAYYNFLTDETETYSEYVFFGFGGSDYPFLCRETIKIYYRNEVIFEGLWETWGVTSLYPERVTNYECIYTAKGYRYFYVPIELDLVILIIDSEGNIIKNNA